jgi:FkbM family methyltransferase
LSLQQIVKDRLVAWGPDNVVTQTALRAAFYNQGFRLEFQPDCIALRKGGRTILMRREDLIMVPVMTEMHDHFFEMLDTGGSAETIDFTKPGIHRYRRTGFELSAPTVAEDDTMPEYTRRFTPSSGMVVFDVGAHAGLTTIELSRMVGDSGRVYAFEPDDEARKYLHENLERSKSANVTVLPVALGEVSGEALFSMDGTQSAGLVDSLVYVRSDKQAVVPVLTLEDACKQAGAVPDYIKTDIEGGEIGMVRGSLDFIKQHPIQMAFETHRLRDGSFTHHVLEPLFREAGYQAEHVVTGPTRQNFLYATPS